MCGFTILYDVYCSATKQKMDLIGAEDRDDSKDIWPYYVVFSVQSKLDPTYNRERYIVILVHIGLQLFVAEVCISAGNGFQETSKCRNILGFSHRLNHIINFLGTDVMKREGQKGS